MRRGEFNLQFLKQVKKIFPSFYLKLLLRFFKPFSFVVWVNLYGDLNQTMNHGAVIRLLPLNLTRIGDFFDAVKTGQRVRNEIKSVYGVTCSQVAQVKQAGCHPLASPNLGAITAISFFSTTPRHFLHSCKQFLCSTFFFHF